MLQFHTAATNYNYLLDPITLVRLSAAAKEDHVDLLVGAGQFVAPQGNRLPEDRAAYLATTSTSISSFSIPPTSSDTSFTWMTSSSGFANADFADAGATRVKVRTVSPT